MRMTGIVMADLSEADGTLSSRRIACAFSVLFQPVRAAGGWQSD